LADFIAELTPSEPINKSASLSQEVVEWVLSVDEASNQHESGAGIVLEGPGGILIEQSIKFAFKASNN